MAEVVLFHHAQGLTSGVVAFADELRRAGHTVHTPDLLDGRTFGSIEDGLAYAEELGFPGEILARGARAVGKFTYEKLDQKGVDGAVNEVAAITGESGGLLRYLQSGRVQRYALLLFAAVGLLSLFLLLANL